MGLAQVEINLNEAGMGTVAVDGHTLSHASYRIEVESGVHEGSNVVIHMHAGVNIRMTAETFLEVVPLPIRESLIEDIASRAADLLAERTKDLR